MTAQELTRVSWSMLRAHAECKQKSHLIRSSKRGPAQNIRSYFHGMVVDAVMRRWLTAPQQTPGAMVAMVDEMIQTVETQAKDDGDGIVRWKNVDDRAELRQFCTELVIRLEPILEALVLPYDYEMGKRFQVPIVVPGLDGTPTTVLLTGEMDILVHDSPNWIVWDLKGTKDDQYWRKVLGQLVFYDLAVLALHGQNTTKTGLIQPMCAKPILEFVITDDDRRAMWARILRYCEDIWKQDHTCKTTTSGCTYCEVRHACPRFDVTQNDTLFGGLMEEARRERP